MIRINLVPFIASSKEQCWAGLEISFFTLTFRVPAVETIYFWKLPYVKTTNMQKNPKETKPVTYTLKNLRFFGTQRNTKLYINFLFVAVNAPMITVRKISFSLPKMEEPVSNCTVYCNTDKWKYIIWSNFNIT